MEGFYGLNLVHGCRQCKPSGLLGHAGSTTCTSPIKILAKSTQKSKASATNELALLGKLARELHHDAIL
eukprot:21876-Pelagomonas_calceolata.AAC.2